MSMQGLVDCWFHDRSVDMIRPRSLLDSLQIIGTRCLFPRLQVVYITLYLPSRIVGVAASWLVRGIVYITLHLPSRIVGVTG